MSKETPTTTPAVQTATPSERFTNAVLSNFVGAAGPAQVTNFQKKLIQNYFIKLDMTLKAAEQKRLLKDEKYRDQLSFDWANVNMPKLALDVVAYSSIGLDPLQPNHINLIPYKNNATNKYDINFMMGYRGIELKAKKYGYDVPNNVIIELVYSSDDFEAIKKDMDNPIEGYRFRINKEFDRGDIVGGFYYFIYKNNPEKNVLKIFNYNDILKRKPSTAATEFWGGEKDEYKDGKKTGNKIEVEGWHDEMCFKTIARAAYNAIPIDSEKIDEHLVQIIQRESEVIPLTKTEELKAEINANSEQRTLSLTAEKNAAPIEVKEIPQADNNLKDQSAPF